MSGTAPSPSPRSSRWTWSREADRGASEALSALDGRQPRVMRTLAQLLHPATPVLPDTLAASAAAREDSGLSDPLRAIEREQGRGPVFGPHRPVRGPAARRLVRDARGV